MPDFSSLSLNDRQDRSYVNAGGTSNTGTATAIRTVSGGYYNGTAPSPASGDFVPAQSDSSGNTKVTESTLHAGEDIPKDVQATQRKPVVSAVYAPTEFASMGSAAGTGVAIKALEGNVYSVWVTNGGTSLRYFQMFNSSTALANGGTPVVSYPIGAASTANPGTLSLTSEHFAPSRYFGTGIAIAMSATNATLGTTGIIAADHNIIIKYT